MKKYTLQTILISVIFLYENTSNYWIYQLNEWGDLVILIYIIIFLYAIGVAIYDIVKCIQAKMKNKNRNIITILMVAVLIMPYLIPVGLVSKRILYKGNLLVAYLDGVAGNNGWLTLYGNNTYEYSYGMKQIKGKYDIKNDTIFFDNPKGDGSYDFDYATLWKDKSHLFFGKDSIAFFHMKVVKNELIK